MMLAIIAVTTVFTVSPLITTLLVSNVLPFLVSLATKMTAPTWMKQAVSALLSAITGLVVTAATVSTNGAATFTKDAILLALGSFLVSQLSYLSLYSPHHANEKIAPEVGIG